MINEVLKYNFLSIVFINYEKWSKTEKINNFAKDTAIKMLK